MIELMLKVFVDGNFEVGYIASLRVLEFGIGVAKFISHLRHREPIPGLIEVMY
jgi:hypothetical protein